MTRSGARSTRAAAHALAARTVPDFAIEADHIARGLAPVAGVDEAGRGPLAGPVVAAAVILDTRHIPKGLADSKLLSAGERERLDGEIRASAHVGLGIGEVDRIDRDNILQATLWAMRQAVAALGLRPGIVLIDGNRCPELPCRTQAIIDGDRLCSSVAAASIIAKVARDRMMAEAARKWPGYGFERHKGYGTPEHRDALVRLGLTPLHRRSFAPVREVSGNRPPEGSPRPNGPAEADHADPVD